MWYNAGGRYHCSQWNESAIHAMAGSYYTILYLEHMIIIHAKRMGSVVYSAH